MRGKEERERESDRPIVSIVGALCCKRKRARVRL